MRTREGNTVYRSDDPIRQAVPKENLCRDCVHLGDLCFSADREFTDLEGSVFRVVTKCNYRIAQTIRTAASKLS